ncbi:LppP/LprE family lipoprotein [Corynebacterium nasicanis]|uniref:LppP/LprE family lipoprotein n=1 Tax=Corynebacterium nasicanis TaxID=1448267 RepID=A0ABW1QFV4_9CORY
MRKLALPLIAVLTLSACSDDRQDVVTVMTTVSEAGAETTSEGEGCANPDATLEDTGLYDNMTIVPSPIGDHKALPTDDGDYLFTFTDNKISDFFDPCQPLSWVVIGGMWGDESGPGGTGASSTAVTVFFHYDELITDPLPSSSKQIMESYRVDDNTIRVIHGQAARSTAEGITDLYNIDHVWRDGQLVTEGADAAAYEAYAAETTNLRP